MAAGGGIALWIDPRGHRFGAGVSAAVLAVAWLTDSRWLVVVAFVTLASGALFGLRSSVYGWAWRRIAGLGGWPPTDLEPEYAARFAQTIGSVVLLIGLGLFAAGQATLGWAATGTVLGLQALLAATGFCLGCRLYFLNWWVPSLVTRWWRRGSPDPGIAGAAPIRRP